MTGVQTCALPILVESLEDHEDVQKVYSDFELSDEAFAKLGYSISLAVPLGIIEIACILLYVIPRTSVLGAVLLTGYLGGAVATNLRTGAPLFSNVLFPVYVGVLLWGGLYLRDNALRGVFPVRRQ